MSESQGLFTCQHVSFIPEQEKRQTKQQEQDLEICIQQMSKTLTDLKKQLQNTALDQASEIFRCNDDQDLLASLKESGAAADLDRVEEHSLKFSEHSEQLQEVSRLFVGAQNHKLYHLEGFLLFCKESI